MILVFYHLRNADSYSIHAAMVNELSTKLEMNVHDVPSMWDWMDEFLSTGAFPHYDSYNAWSTPGRVGHFNQLIGGVKFNAVRQMPPDACVNAPRGLATVYDPKRQQCVMVGGQEMPGDESKTHWIHYGIGLDEVGHNLAELRGSHEAPGIIDEYATQLDVSMVTYNGEYGLYSSTTLDFSFPRSGMMTKLFSQESVDPDPYVNTWMYIIDAMFVFRTLQLMYAESKELIPAAQNGLDGILDYMEFWNAIDWISIVSGLITGVFWLRLVLGTYELNSVITKLPMSAAHDKFYHFAQNTTWLSEENLMKTFSIGQTEYENKLDEILDDVGTLTGQVLQIRYSMSVFTFVMMFRFFKAFRANPRLSIATNTLSGAAVDIVHFGVVFAVIFLSFALIGHISFGHLHPGFRSMYFMCLTCWDILMGDFDSMALVALDSRMGPLWNLGFMSIVLLILLNMLLAIIFDTYGEVKSKQGSDVLTIWAQAYHTYHQMNEQRGFVASWPIICEFEDDDDPAHPEDIVTAESLRAAFTARDGINMSFAQATYMVEKAAEWVKAEFEKNQDSLTIENVLVSMAKMTGMVRRIQEKTWEKMSYIQDMNATTRQMLTFIPGVPNLPVMFGAGASPREQTIPMAHQRGNVFGGALNAAPGGIG